VVEANEEMEGNGYGDGGEDTDTYSGEEVVVSA